MQLSMINLVFWLVCIAEMIESEFDAEFSRY